MTPKGIWSIVYYFIASAVFQGMVFILIPVADKAMVAAGVQFVITLISRFDPQVTDAIASFKAAKDTEKNI